MSCINPEGIEQMIEYQFFLQDWYRFNQFVLAYETKTNKIQ